MMELLYTEQQVKKGRKKATAVLFDAQLSPLDRISQEGKSYYRPSCFPLTVRFDAFEDCLELLS